MAAKLIFECPNDGEFLIAWLTFPGGRCGLDSRGRGQSWDIERLGYVGTPEERAEPHPGMYAVAEPAGDDVAHWRYRIACQRCDYSVRMTGETEDRVIHPILRALHEDDATWAEPVVSATHLQKLMNRGETVFARQPTPAQVREFIRRAVDVECP